MPYVAVADVNYYQMEGEWNRVDEEVIGSPFATVEDAQAACARRRGDQIAWEQHDETRWTGYEPTSIVEFKIWWVPERPRAAGSV
ncbi:hypothetical protein [Deinococcus aestuarii]|uniref:hypothetical protein n=1 Tax=Deinococcus aestuarii TaxID=2774531 RepID=UPI001C0E8622|nr:hypothetical protein [Deinococcus aestuarii]